MGDLSINFSRSEFLCKCGACGFDTVDTELLETLEWLRRDLDKPVHINSGCRCKEYNSRIGGSALSQHTLGRAADIRVKGVAPTTIYQILDEVFGDTVSLGLYQDKGFVHVDTRTDGGKRWKS